MNIAKIAIRSKSKPTSTVFEDVPANTISNIIGDYRYNNPKDDVLHITIAYPDPIVLLKEKYVRLIDSMVGRGFSEKQMVDQIFETFSIEEKTNA